nr:hypothetical protein [Escherichia coli]
MNVTLDIPDDRASAADTFDGTTRVIGELDDIPDTVLVLADNKQAGDKVADDRLRSEAYGDTDQTGARDEWPQYCICVVDAFSEKRDNDSEYDKQMPDIASDARERVLALLDVLPMPFAVPCGFNETPDDA